MPRDELQDLKNRIDSLPPPDRLRLAASLLEARKTQLAYAIIDRVKVELGAAMMLAEAPPARTGGGR
ncbi:MAG: hypothetical protein ABUR63_00375 [Verrucomicrobiota bacterium]